MEQKTQVPQQSQIDIKINVKGNIRQQTELGL